VQGVEGEPGSYNPNVDEEGGPGVIGHQGPLGLYRSKDTTVILRNEWMFVMLSSLF
jgi:hypothetical protein